ncbi:hypothetical protein EJB05_28903, partial [Eragrostis curvula]
MPPLSVLAALDFPCHSRACARPTHRAGATIFHLSASREQLGVVCIPTAAAATEISSASRTCSSLASPLQCRRRLPGDGMAKDRISALPDGVREHLLSFLPAHEGVRTSVLARSWRDLWTRSPALHITCWGTAAKFSEFVSRLLQHRLPRPASTASWAPLDSCQFDFDADEEEELDAALLDMALVDGWIRSALRCNVQDLVIDFYHGYCTGDRLELEPGALASEHLTKIHLFGVYVCDDIDFSACPALLDLGIDTSDLVPKEIRSQSLQRLSITNCCFGAVKRTRIRAPNLLSFNLKDCLNRAPLLQRMPSLISATVQLDQCHASDQCYTGNIRGCGTCDGCVDYYGPHNDHRTCLLLNGLAEARNLELLAHPDLFIYRRDIKCCPTFWNLKTLVLTDWFVAEDFSGLIWFLQNSPILEKLTLQISEVQTDSVRTEGKFKHLEPSVVSDRLKTVEIKCREVDAMVIKILNVLAASGIPLEKINIQSSPIRSGCEFLFTQ